jgi:CRP/FNR family cyclic AMP-dependent transcriptional regulator
MPIVGEMNAQKLTELQNAAVVGSSQPISFIRELSRPVIAAPIARNTPLTAAEQLSEITRTICYPGRSVLFHQGERPAGVFILKRGTVKLSMTSSKGRAVILRIVRSGEMLALSSVLSVDPCFATAETLEETEVAYVEREQFLDFLLHNPEAALSVASQACSNYKNACRQISLLGLCRSASERLAQFLLNWAPPKSYRDATTVWLGLTHEEIAQVAGTTRETVTRTLVDFRKKGWASLASSRLELIDREALEKLVA